MAGKPSTSVFSGLASLCHREMTGRAFRAALLVGSGRAGATSGSGHLETSCPLPPPVALDTDDPFVLPEVSAWWSGALATGSSLVTGVNKNSSAAMMTEMLVIKARALDMDASCARCDPNPSRYPPL